MPDPPHQTVMRNERTMLSDSSGLPAIPGDIVEVLRLATMVQTLYDQVRNVPLDDSARQRLIEIHRRAVDAIAAELSPDLRLELTDLVGPLDEERTSASDLRIIQATLTGWLQGLFQGLQYVHATQIAAAGYTTPAQGAQHDAPRAIGQYL